MDRLRGWSPPTLLLGALVALLSWNVIFFGPGGGIDSSWGAGLFMAVEQGLDFGDEVVFTYGPLGFLGRADAPLWFSDLAVITFIYTALLYVALCTVLIWVLRRSVGGPAACVITYLAVAVLPGIETALVLAVACAFATLTPERPAGLVWALVVGGALFAALESMIKLSIGPPIALIVLLALVGARARPRLIVVYLALFAACFAGIWLIVGQSLADLDDYIVNGRQIISGYSDAMGMALAPGWLRFAATFVLVGFVAGAMLADYRDRRARICGTLVAAIAGFALFKEGMVRFDDGHITVFLSTMLVLWLVLPWRRARLAIPALGAVALVAVALLARPEGFGYRLNPIDNVDVAVAQTRTLLEPSRQEEIRAFARALMIDVYALEPQTLAELRGHTVAIEPWEIAVAWAYDLDWSPLPVIQGYSAYTTELDELNAAEVASPDGPERILRASEPALVSGEPGRIGAIDGRYAAWDPPAQALASLCNFAPLQQTERWQVLGRIPERCEEPEAVATAEASEGAFVDVPAAGRGEVVFVRIEGAGVGGLEKLRSLLYRAEFRMALTDDDTFRLVPGTAEDGLLLRGDPRLTGSGAFAQAPQTETIAVTGAGDDLSYEFFRMRVGAG